MIQSKQLLLRNIQNTLIQTHQRVPQSKGATYKKAVPTRFAHLRQVMNKRQHGFRHGRCCLTSTFYTLEQWAQVLNKKTGHSVLYSDIRQAFDCMLQKLNESDICGGTAGHRASLPKGRREILQVYRNDNWGPAGLCSRTCSLLAINE